MTGAELNGNARPLKYRTPRAKPLSSTRGKVPRRNARTRIERNRRHGNDNAAVTDTSRVAEAAKCRLQTRPQHTEAMDIDAVATSCSKRTGFLEEQAHLHCVSGCVMTSGCR